MKLRTGLLAAVVGVVALAAQAAPDDPHYPMQWGLERVRASEAWSVSKGEGIVVAIVDSGIDLSHPDLSGAIARDAQGKVLGRDFVDDDDDPTDEHGHGTMVAGIAGARTANGIGVASVAPLIRLMPVRVLDGEAAGTSGDVDAGIRWAVDNGAHVVNLSLEIAREDAAGAGVAIVGSQAPDEAVRHAWRRGVVVVAAAGNDSSAFTDFDDSTPVLLVGASNREDGRASFSDTGRADAVVAPGVEIVSTWCDPCGGRAEHTYGQSEGTSYAAPHVAGAVALLLASGLGPDEAVERLRESAVDIGPAGPDGDTGRGRIDVAAALGIASESPSRTPS
ncbi:MAG: S8 family serine peptidase, partial [Nitriliruptorales bacterium]